MEAKVNILFQNSTILGGGNKNINFNKNKNFNSTIESSMKVNKEKNQFQAKIKKAINTKESNLEKNIANLESKEQVDDPENQVKDEKEIDLPINYDDKYNLFLNICKYLPESDEDLDFIVDENINILDLDFLLKIKPDEVENINILDEELLENISKIPLNQNLNKELLVDEEILEKDVILKLNVDKSTTNKIEKEENKTNSKLLNTNESLELNESEILNSEDNKLNLTNSTSNEEITKNFREIEGFKGSNAEETTEDSGVKLKEKTNLQDKISFSLEKQEVEIKTIDNPEVKDNEPIDKKEFMNHILEKVKFNLNNNNNQIKVTLKPESLGEMVMELEVVKNSLVAKIMVDNHKSKEIIENNLFQLKEGIKDSGLEIKTFEVFVGNNSDFDKHNSNQFNFNGRNKKIKLKKEVQDKKIGLYEDNIKIDERNPIYLSSGTSLNLFA